MTGNEEGPKSSGQYIIFSETRILSLEPERQVVRVLYESNDKKKLSNARPIVGKYAIYFVETDLEFQQDRIMRITLPDENGRSTGIKDYRSIYTMHGSDILAMQFCNDSLQRADDDYNVGLS